MRIRVTRTNSSIPYLLRLGSQRDIPRGLERTAWATPYRIWGPPFWFVVVSEIYIIVHVYWKSLEPYIYLYLYYSWTMYYGEQ